MMRIRVLPTAAVVFAAATLLFKLISPHATSTWAATGGGLVAVISVASLLFCSRTPSRRTRAAALALLTALVPLWSANQKAARTDPVWEHLKAQIRHDIAHGCPGERGVAARTLFETWTHAHRPTTIDCAPTHGVGTYGNGLRLSITVAGQVNPTCPQPRDRTYMVGRPALVLHWCEPASS